MFANPFEIGGLQGCGDRFRQGVGDDALRLRRIVRLLHSSKNGGVSPVLGQAADEVERGIDDAPGQIAADGGHEHDADVSARDIGDAQCAGEREDHDESKDDFREAFQRVENAVAGNGGRH